MNVCPFFDENFVGFGHKEPMVRVKDRVKSANHTSIINKVRKTHKTVNRQCQANRANTNRSPNCALADSSNMTK